jgi:hypothetical protein
VEFFPQENVVDLCDVLWRILYLHQAARVHILANVLTTLNLHGVMGILFFSFFGLHVMSNNMNKAVFDFFV